MTVRGALTIAGTVAGSYFGPVGGAIGGMIGGAIGGAIEGPTHSSQAILEDLGALKLDYGSTWPRMYGRYRFKVSPIWSSEKRPIANDQEVDAKGGPSAVNTTYTYEQDWMCWAPLNAIGFTRVWRNGELVYAALADTDAETLAASGDTSAWESITFFDGAADQMPWSVYEAAVGTENAVAYRHRPLLCMESLDLGNSGQAPLIEVEFVSAGAFEPADELILQNTFSSGTATEESCNAAEGTINGTPTIVGNFRTNGVTLATAAQVEWAGPQFDVAPGTGFTIEFDYTYSGSANVAYDLILKYEFKDSFAQTAYYALGNYGSSDNFSVDTPGNFGSPDTAWGYYAGNGKHVCLELDAEDTLRLYLNGVLQQEVENYGYGGITPGFGKLILGPAATPGLAGSGSDAPRNYTIDNIRMSRGPRYNGENFTPPSSLPEPVCDLLIGDPVPVDLADIVRAEALLEWTGEAGALTAADIDVSELEGIPVTGYATTGSPREAIASLTDAYYFQAVCSDKLYFRLRGGASAATIPFADTGAGVGDPAEPFTGLERGNDLEVALQVAFTAPGLLRDYEPDTQHSDRLVGESFELRRYQSPVVFEPAEAKGRADTMVYDARVAAHTASLSLDDAYIALEPTDVVTATDDEGNSYRVRIERETYADGVRGFDVVLDDPTVLLSSGITAATDQRAISIAGPADTELILLDGPLLRPADDSPGHYAAVQGSGRWPGAAVYRAPTETGTYERIVSVRTSAVAGVTTTELADWTGGNVFDESSVVRVQVTGGTLSNASREDLIEGATVNAFAIGAHGRWEVVQATTAALVSPGVYDLSGLLRGRLGTEHAMGSHAAGDTVIKLQAAGIISSDGTAAEIGVTRFWKGVTVGQTLQDAESQEFTNEAVRLKPLAPVDLRCSRDGSGGFAITWARRSRLAADVFATLPLGEASEAYEVDILDGDDVVRTLSATSTTAAYNAAQQVADFGGVQSSIDVAVYQMSATVGRGYPLLGTLSTSYTPATQSNTITLAGTFASGVPISVYANGLLIGSRTSLIGDTNLAGVATGLAAVVNAHASYSASAVGSVITVTGSPGAVYTLTSIVGGSSAISAVMTQEAALAGPGSSYIAECYVSNLATGTTEPIPAGTSFTITVKQGSITRRTATYTTTAEAMRADVIFGLADAFNDDSYFADHGIYFSAASSDVGGIYGLFSGPTGDPSWGAYGGGSSPFTISVSITNPGSESVAEDSPQIVDVNVTGTPKNGEVFRVTLGGENFTYTATVPTDTREQVIDGLVADIDADADYSAAQISGTKLQATGAVIGEFSYSASITRGITATVA
jgi:hypothetical protein